MKKDKEKIPELLAPVGGWDQLRAAVCNGADAVYMGGSLFNARMKADNFGSKGLAEAVDFAHERDVKTYITFNTLIKDKELPKAFEYACELYESNADGLILQDIGLARLIQKYIPDFEIHLSTQATTYNKEALDIVKEWGFSRVVPARELSLDELDVLCAYAHELGMDVEVFAHGALCMCYSGQCQMSRLLGGGSARSGNRGLCAQPCRLQYTDDGGEKGYLLSPKDLRTIEEIPRLCKVGVDSLKIEGRLKSPEYVAVVTRIYRKYLDIYSEIHGRLGDEGLCEQEYRKLIAESDMAELTQIFNRGGFTDGYLNGNRGDDILSGKSPKNSGVYIGQVKNILPIKRTKKQGSKTSKSGRKMDSLSLIDLKLAKSTELHMGDIVEIAGVSAPVTYIQELTSGLLRIGDFNLAEANINLGTGAKPGSNKLGRNDAYRVADSALNAKARDTFANADKKLPITMNFTAKVGAYPVLEIRENSVSDARDENIEADWAHLQDCNSVRIEGTQIAEEAINKPLSVERIKLQLSKLGDVPFEIRNDNDINALVDENVRLPISALNDMRRKGVELLLEEKRASHRLNIEADIFDAALSEIEETTGEVALNEPEELHSRTVASGMKSTGVDKTANLNSQTLIPIEDFMKEAVIENVIPYILNVSKGKLDAYLEEHFDEIVAKVKASGSRILIGNLGWIKQFQDVGVKVYGDYGLNAYNAQTVKAFENIGVEMLFMSDEMSEDGYHCYVNDIIKKEAPHRVPVELEKVPLMITEHPLNTDFLIDRKGVKHEVLPWKSADKYLIF